MGIDCYDGPTKSDLRPHMTQNPPIVLSVIMPVYNEEKTIEKVVVDHIRALKEIGGMVKDWEIVCLDDASTDSSLKILEGLAQKEARVVVARHLQNKGIYQSYMDVYTHTRGTHIYHTAADEQWPAENLKRLLEHLIRTQADFVIGVRENRQEIYSVWRRVLSYGFNILPQIFFGVKTVDANGIKLGRREIFLLDTKSRSFFVEIERVIKAKKQGFRIEFAPIIFLQRKSGKARGAKWSNIINTFRDFMKFWLEARI